MSKYHQIYIENVKKKRINLEKKYPNSLIIDVTSKANLPWRKFSPFFDHEKIPVPGMENTFGNSVEGIWQGLKIFENHGVDLNYILKSTSNLKRTTKSFGTTKGHQFENRIIGYVDARKLIYLPAYNYILDNFLSSEVNELCKLLEEKNIVLLDYNVNIDMLNIKQPLSHACLIKDFMYQKLNILIVEEQNKQYSLF
jgi:hypothetical protein